MIIIIIDTFSRTLFLVRKLQRRFPKEEGGNTHTHTALGTLKKTTKLIITDMSSLMTRQKTAHRELSEDQPHLFQREPPQSAVAAPR